MPIYEFYCADCHTLFSFLARTPNTRKRPGCPRCKRPRLERRASAFAISSGRAERDPDDGPALDENGMDAAVARLASEAEQIDENDPRQIAGMMRRLFDAARMPMGDAMQEAVRRMEGGEDPDAIEAEMGDLLEGEDALFDESATGEARGNRLRRLRRRVLPPQVDPTLHDL